ncbi:MAG: restriction endonuclease subunit S [Chromatiales bacterium]
MPYIGMEHVESHTMRLLGTVPAATMKSMANRFYAGDVLYGRLRPYLNKVYRADFDGLCSAEFIVLPKTEGVDPDFLRYRLNSRDFVSFTTHLDAGDRPRVDFDQISPFEIEVPEPNEQRRIVAELETQLTRLDASVTALKRVQANLKRYRASVLKAACEGRLVPTEAELARCEGRTYESGSELLHRLLNERQEQRSGRGIYKTPISPDTGELPAPSDGWTWASAEQCTSIITDGEHITPERTASGIFLLSARNVLDGRLSLTDVDFVPQHEYDRIAKRLVINSGDVLLSCSGSVGRSTIAPDGLVFTLVRSVAVLKPLASMGRYLSLAIRSPLLQQQIAGKKTQTAQANIFQGKIKTLCIPLPPLLEQHRIVAEVERRLSVIEELEATVAANLKRAARLRQSVLVRAFAG